LLESRIAELDKNKNLAVVALNESTEAFGEIIKQLKTRQRSSDGQKGISPFFERAVRNYLEVTRLDCDIIQEFAPNVSNELETKCSELETTLLSANKILNIPKYDSEQKDELIKLLKKVLEILAKIEKISDIALSCIKGTLNKIKN